MEEIYSCSWRYGIHWLKETWSLFKRAPFVWLLAGLFCEFIMLIPAFFSSLVSLFLKGGISFFIAPVLLASLLSMAYQCDQGRKIKVNQLFSGFSFLGSFIVLQVINALFLLLAYGISAVMAISIGALLLPFLFILGALLLIQLSWFAPVLIILGGKSAWVAMKMSLAGCIKSWRAWLIALLGMGLIWISAFFIFVLIYLIFNSLGLSSLIDLNAEIIFTPIFSILMVAHILLIYIAYRDVFGMAQ